MEEKILNEIDDLDYDYEDIDLAIERETWKLHRRENPCFLDRLIVGTLHHKILFAPVTRIEGGDL